MVLLETKVPAVDRSCVLVGCSKHDPGHFSQEECQRAGFLPLASLLRLYLSDENVG